MKKFVLVLDFLVLGGLIFGMYALMGDTYREGGVLGKTLIMAVVGGIYGGLRAIYRKWLVPEDENNK